jgi:DNA/RNA endonuclease YhcR with UshA esterase domain
VQTVRRTHRSLWVELVDGPSLRIAGEELDRFDYPDPTTLPGKQIEARGWLYPYRGRLNMRIRHPAALSIRR